VSQFDLYKNDNKNSNKTYPYFVDVQSNLLDELNSRVVIPLSLHKTLNQTNAKRLCPVIDVKDKHYVLLTHQMTSVPKTILKKKVTTLEGSRGDILGAIDVLITGI